MVGSVTYGIWLDRDSGYFDITVDYYIPGYNDPETGEAFYDTSWNFSFFDANSGSGGTVSGYGWDQGTGQLSIGFPPGETIADATASFSAFNSFSGESAQMDWHILNAGYALEAKTLTGGSLLDIIVSGRGNDVLKGLGGNDYLDSGDGDDRLEGGDGADQLIGGAGKDRMFGGLGDDYYQVDHAGDAAVELDGGGNDWVMATVSYRLGAYVERLVLAETGALNGIGNAQDNRIDGNAFVNVLDGAGGNDQLYGYAGNDTLRGGSGDDLLDGGEGGDRMEGGIGDDNYVVSSGADRLIERPGEGADTARVLGTASYTLGAHIENLVNISDRAVFQGTGNAAANILTGAYNSDHLNGLAGNDVLDGGMGDDVLQGGRGADQLIGGAGVDLASYAAATSSVSVNLATGQGLRGEAIGDTFVAIEGLTGSAFNDSLTGNGQDNRLNGGAGIDTLIGGGGRDWLNGGAGADILSGGADDDGVSYAGSAAAVTVDLHLQTASGGDAQGDSLSSFVNAEGSGLADMLYGSGGANLLIGGAGADTLDGRGGADTLRGGAGADTLIGGAGEDVLSYAGSAAAVTINLATSTASGGEAQGDSFSGIEGVVGSAFADHLTGDGGNNALRGDAGTDTLLGGGGNDIINGGAGADVMDGGAGIDTLSFADSTAWVSVFLYDNLALGADGYGDSVANFENIRGGEVGDALYGNAGANRIEGRAGGDFLSGKEGADTLVGGSGDDTFYFGFESAEERILDLLAGGAEDKVYVDLGSAFDSFAEVMAVATNVGGDTHFSFGGALELVLVGVLKESLTTSDFYFG